MTSAEDTAATAEIKSDTEINIKVKTTKDTFSISIDPSKTIAQVSL